MSKLRIVLQNLIVEKKMHYLMNLWLQFRVIFFSI
jgi:hypothetical protein